MEKGLLCLVVSTVVVIAAAVAVAAGVYLTSKCHCVMLTKLLLNRSLIFIKFCKRQQRH